MIDHQHELFFVGDLDELLALCAGFGHRLFQEQVFSRFEGLLAEGKMRGDRRGDGDGLHVIADEEFLVDRNGLNAGEFLLCNLKAFGRRIEYHDTLNRGCRQEIPDKIGAPVAETHDTDFHRDLFLILPRNRTALREEF